MKKFLYPKPFKRLDQLIVQLVLIHTEDRNFSKVLLMMFGSTIAHFPLKKSPLSTTSRNQARIDLQARLFTLAEGTGDTDNASFTIDDDQLKIVDSLNFEAKPQHSIR